MKKVKLTYFKDSGKYYMESFYETKYIYDFDIYAEVRRFEKEGILPGLESGHWKNAILVDPEDGVKAIVFPN